MVAGKSGDHAGALAEADEAIALAPSNADAHYLRGIALRGLKRVDEAVHPLRQALLLRPDHALAMLALGKILVRTSDEKTRGEGMALLAKAADVPATAVKALDALGHALRASGRRVEAVDAFSRLAALRPGCADTHNNLGVALQEAGEIGAAVSSFESAVRAEYGHVEARFNLGLCLLLEGDYRRGLELYEWRAALKSSGLPSMSSLRHWRGRFITPTTGGRN